VAPPGASPNPGVAGTAPGLAVTFTATRDVASTMLQIAELAFFSELGEKIPMVCGGNDIATPPDAPIEHINDGNPDTKFLDFNFGALGHTVIVCNFPRPYAVASYEITTANDNPSRDPIALVVALPLPGPLPPGTIAEMNDPGAVPLARGATTQRFETTLVPITTDVTLTVSANRGGAAALQIGELELRDTDGKPLPLHCNAPTAVSPAEEAVRTSWTARPPSSPTPPLPHATPPPPSTASSSRAGSSGATGSARRTTTRSATLPRGRSPRIRGTLSRVT